MTTEQGETRISGTVPEDHECRMKTFVLMHGMTSFASGVQLSDGRVVVVHRTGREDMHPDIDHLTRDYVGMAGLVWDRDSRWTPGSERPRRFVFVRHQDVSGLSGDGVVMEGAQFPDGRVVVAWLGRYPSVVHWPNMEQAVAVHCHQGDTTVAWVDEAVHGV